MPRKASNAWVPFILSMPAGLLQKETKIPAPVIHGYRTGRYKMGVEAAHRLKNLYESIQYKRLKSSGVSRRQAKYISRRSPEQVTSSLTRQMQIAEEIYLKSEIYKAYKDYEHGLQSILEWMSRFASRTLNDWDIYLKQKTEWITRREYLKMKKRKKGKRKKIRK